MPIHHFHGEEKVADIRRCKIVTEHKKILTVLTLKETEESLKNFVSCSVKLFYDEGFKIYKFKLPRMSEERQLSLWHRMIRKRRTVCRIFSGNLIEIYQGWHFRRSIIDIIQIALIAFLYISLWCGSNIPMRIHC